MLSALFGACNQNKDNKELTDDQNNPEAADEVEANENQVLYDEVMKIHNEVMPKLEDIYTRKQKLKKQLADSPGLTAEEKQSLELKIAKLDSAYDGMMDWMHKFERPSDSEGEEKAREYLENEMEKVKKVREDILTALQEVDSNE
jgi:hypothetical protein